MKAKIESARKLKTIISEVRWLHEVLWEAWNIITSVILFGLRVILVPIFAIIIVADFIIASTIVAVVGFALAFLMGWISLDDVLVYIDAHGTAFAAGLSAHFNAWAAAHPSSVLSQAFDAGATTHLMPGGIERQ